MALDDVGHVEAVALIRRLVENPEGADPEAIVAGRNWLEVNHPSMSAYVAAAGSIGEPRPDSTVPEATLSAVSRDMTKEVAEGVHRIDEWLEARGIDPDEMRAFIDVMGKGDGAVGMCVQIGFELVARKYAVEIPGISS